MFAHEIIESLVIANQRFNEQIKHCHYDAVTTKSLRGLQKLNENLIALTRTSFRFFVEDFNIFLDDGPLRNLKGNPIFSEFTQYIKLPYKHFALMSRMLPSDPRFSEPIKDTQHHCPKRCTLSVQLDDETIVVHVINGTDKEVVDGVLWGVSPVVYFIRIGMQANADWISGVLGKYFGKEVNIPITQGYGNIYPLKLLSLSDNDVDTIVREDTPELALLNEVLILLNCKNITTETHKPDIKLNKARRKKGKQELFEYKTLKLLLPGNKEKHLLKNEPTGEHNRIHFCRGHFKEYTAEAPLFGRITGLWWWQPHVRGQNKDGVVMKDYNVGVKNNGE